MTICAVSGNYESIKKIFKLYFLQINQFSVSLIRRIQFNSINGKHHKGKSVGEEPYSNRNQNDILFIWRRPQKSFSQSM